MVCLGNICRSPMAHGIMEKKIREQKLDWEVDSAGTSGWHDGQRPDARAVKLSKVKGVDISDQISRKIRYEDIDNYDLILVMDASNYQHVMELSAQAGTKANIQLIMNFRYPNRNMAVPDPYYDDKFEEAFDLLDDAMDYVIKSLLKENYYNKFVG